jgi:transcriptional regulator with XRE-family HTH domain
VRKVDKRKRDERLVKFGANLRAARANARHTQEELADVLGISVAYVSLLERGGRNPPLTLVLEFAEKLGVAPRALVEGEGALPAGRRSV